MDADLKQTFSDRLNESLDAVGYPRKGAGRQVRLAKDLGVSQKGARKWLEAEAIPSMEHAIALALICKVQTEWLYSGRGRRDLTPETKRFSPDVEKFAERMEQMPPAQRARVLPAIEILTTGYPDSRAA